MEDQLAFPELHNDLAPDTQYFHQSLDLKDLKAMKEDLLAQERFDGSDIFQLMTAMSVKLFEVREELGCLREEADL